MREPIQRLLCIIVRELSRMKGKSNCRYSPDEFVETSELWDEYDRLTEVLSRYPRPDFEAEPSFELVRRT